MDLFKSLLVIHIIAGSISFLVAPIALIVKKGSRNHRLWGKIFFYSMVIVAVTAVILAPMHNNLFLTLVAVFSFYLAFSGYRAIYRKAAYQTGKAKFIDWFFCILNALFSGTFLVVGIMQLPAAFGIISIVFGSIGTMLSLRDALSFVRPSSEKHKWLFSHMIGMIAAYIAAVSAFSAVNLNFEWLPPAIQWLWPTIIGVPLMNRWVKSYKMKLNKGRELKELVSIERS